MRLTVLLKEFLEFEVVPMQISIAGRQCDLSDPELLTVHCDDIDIDSRNVVYQGIFLALLGSQTDGRNYINSAIDAGAVAVFYELNQLSSEQKAMLDKADCACIGIADLSAYASKIAAIFFGSPSEVIQVYGITGTNGKTSCAYLLAQAFNNLGYRTAFMGTIGIGLPYELSATSHTTLDAVTMQRYLAKLVDEGFTHACIEVSSHALDQYRVKAVNFYGVLYTNLSQDHLDYHGDMQSYAAAKKRLFTEFEPSLAVINVDDQMGQALLQEVNAEFIVSYGSEGSAADAVAEDVKATKMGLSFLLESQTIEVTVNSPLLGLLNIPNLMLVVTTLLALGVDVEQVGKCMQACQAAPGRMELFVGQNKPMVVVDYAHTPEAIKAALQSCRVHCDGQLWIVFGCGGDRDQFKRPLMGQMAEKYADQIVVCSDNPRTESAEEIIAAIVKPMLKPPMVIEHRATAVAYAIQQASVNDLVLLAGKGHETGQIIGEKILPYSDREWAKECLGVAA